MKTPRTPHLSHLLLLSLLFLLTSCHRNPHFLTDRAYRQQVEQDYAARLSEFSMLSSQLQLDTLCRMEKEAMQFLYAYMPYSDLADYTPDFYLQQVRYAFTARKPSPKTSSATSSSSIVSITRTSTPPAWHSTMP